MCYIINLLTIVLGLLSFSAISKTEDTSEQSNSGVVDRFYVGSDNACNFSTIQAAINAASSSQNSPEVLVAYNKQYDENLIINGSNVLLDGDYANCTDAKNGVHGNDRAVLKGSPGSQSATIQITGPVISIKNIQIVINDNGGILANSTSNINLENMLFFQLGDSAIKVVGDGQIDLKVKKSSFLLNSAENGAGIYCDGNNHSIEVTEDTGFASNSATGNGGAVYLSDGCVFTMSDGAFQNSNASNGGGIFAYNSTIILENIIFDSNFSTNEGGAIFAFFITTINAENIHFLNNQSGNLAGAVALLDSDLQLKTNPNSCTNNKCNYFNNNKSIFGGAILLQNGSANISSTYFENNRANFGTALSILESTVKIEGSVFNNNGNNGTNGYDDGNVFYFGDDANTTISYSTFADNNIMDSTFMQESNSILNVYSSIIYDTNGGDIFDIGPNSTNDVNCLIVHEDQSFDSSSAFVTIADPLFVDTANGNYHINAANSPAIDYCDDTLANAQFLDIDNQARGFDEPTVPNNPITDGTYDIGADEASDLIFSNDFEAQIPCRPIPMKQQNKNLILKSLKSPIKNGGSSCII